MHTTPCVGEHGHGASGRLERTACRALPPPTPSQARSLAGQGRTTARTAAVRARQVRLGASRRRRS